MFDVIPLGVASALPTLNRHFSATAVVREGRVFLFDCGEGTQLQLGRAALKRPRIEAIFITHFHGDHCLGLAGMSQRISLDRVAHPVHIHYPGSGQVYYDRLRKASIFHDVADIVPHPITAPGVIYRDKKLTISTLPLDHGVPTWGFRMEEADSRRMLPERLEQAGVRGPQIGQLIRDGQITIDGKTVELVDVSVDKPGQSAAFIMDTRMCENALELARGVDLLICESTFLARDADKAHAHGHLTAAQAATIARDAGARMLVLTHFSQRYPATQAFLDEAAPIFADVIAARDADVIPVPPRL